MPVSLAGFAWVDFLRRDADFRGNLHVSTGRFGRRLSPLAETEKRKRKH
jgi:hypothetical protein